MKFLIERKKLSAVLKLAGEVAGKSSTLPILGHVKLWANAGAELIISASNLDVSLSQSLRQGESLLSVEVGGETSVSCLRLLAAVEAMVGERVEVRLDGSRLALDCGDDAVKLLCLGVEEFPAMLGNADGGKAVQVDDFGRLCRVLPAVSKDATWYVLNGVCFDGGAGVVVATDGRQLMKVSGPLMRLEAIVPAAVMRLVQKLAGGAPVNLEFGEHNIVAEGVDWKLGAKLIGGNFPNYAQVIPKPAGREVRVPRGRFLATFAVARAVDGRDHAVTLREDAGALCVSCESPEGDSRSMVMGAVPPRFFAKFNSDFLHGILKACEGAEVSLDMHDEFAPCLFVDGDFEAVLMPMRGECRGDVATAEDAEKRGGTEK